MNLLRKILLVTIIAWNAESTEAAELKCTCNCQDNNPLPFENSVTESSETTELKCICNCQRNNSLFADSKIEARKHSKFAPIM